MNMYDNAMTYANEMHEYVNDKCRNDMSIMSMRKMMEDNTTIVVVASNATEMDSIHLIGFNQVNCPVSNVVGQGGEVAKNACGPHHV